jgi:hypothetical protein
MTPSKRKHLAYRNALQIGDTHFDDAYRRLREAIEEILEEKAVELRAREEKERLDGPAPAEGRTGSARQ